MGILHPVQASAFKRGCWRVLKRATKLIEGLEKRPYREENLKTSICLHYLKKKKRLRGDLMTGCKYLHGEKRAGIAGSVT